MNFHTYIQGDPQDRPLYRFVRGIGESAGDSEGKGGWVTTESGTHVFIENGRITKGPTALVNKTHEEANAHEKAHGPQKSETESLTRVSQSDTIGKEAKDTPKPEVKGETKVSTQTATQYGTGIQSSGAHDSAFYRDKIQPAVDSLVEPTGGSDKQKKWAADLQYQWLQGMAKRLIGKENTPQVDEYLAKVVKLANSKTDAKFWIDNRNSDPISTAKILGW